MGGCRDIRCYIMAWYNTSWSNRFSVESQNAKVLEAVTNGYYDLANAPAGFWAVVKNGGGDIRVTKSDGTTEVAREVVSCDTGGETGEVHFDTTGILTGSDVTWYIYYGNAGASDYAEGDPYGREAVWEAAYKFVSHMNDDPDTSHILDSTSNDNDGTKVGAGTPAENTSSKMGAGQTFTSGEYIDAGFNPDADIGDGNPFTLQSWMYLTSYPSAYATFMSAHESVRWYMFIKGDNDPFIGIGGEYHETAGVPITPNDWSRVTVVYDGNNLLVYTNAGGPATDVFGVEDFPNTSLYIGRAKNGTNPFVGTQDEIRISSGARSGNWITTTYNNQNDPSTFWSTGAQESPTVGKILALPSTAGGMSVMDGGMNG